MSAKTSDTCHEVMTLEERIEWEIERSPTRSDEWVNAMLKRFGISRA
ncbi:hypothetical protein ABT274_12580 [Streptomyces sp. NPDC001127]